MQTDVSMDEARAFLARAERAFETGDREGVLDLFHDDVVVVFADFPPMHGKEQYREFLKKRFARQLEYRPRTVVRMVSANAIGSTWEATWIDAHDGRPMRGRGCEFVVLREGKVVEFIVSFNAWNEAEGPRTPIV